MNSNEEVTIKLTGKLSLELPELDQLKIRNIIDKVLINYEINPKEKHLVVSDIPEKIQYFLAVKKLDGAKSSTLYNYNLSLNKFSEFIHKTVNSITTVDIRMYLATISNCKNLKSTSINNKISTLKSFFSWLENEEMIIKNPMRKIKNVKVPKRLRHSLTQDELELLRDACKTIRQRAILEFLFSTGCRLAEMVNVNKDDIKWDKGEITVIGKGDKERIVFINAKAKLYLKKYLKQRENIENPALFVTIRKPNLRLGRRSIEKEINAIAESAGINKPVYPHLIRHTTATLALKAGMSLTSIQSILGHEDPSTTQIYAETNTESVKEEYKKFLTQ